MARELQRIAPTSRNLHPVLQLNDAARGNRSQHLRIVIRHRWRIEMRNDPFHSSTRNNDPMGLAGVITGYAAIAAIFVFFVILLVAGHRHAGAPTQTHAMQGDYFGIEELVDLLAAEPAVPPANLFVLPKPRPLTRAELELKHNR
jgi:hypothetical protein